MISHPDHTRRTDLEVVVAFENGALLGRDSRLSERPSMQSEVCGGTVPCDDGGEVSKMKVRHLIMSAVTQNRTVQIAVVIVIKALLRRVLVW